MDRAGIDPGVREAVPPTVELDEVIGPEPPEHLELLLDAPSTRPKVHTERLVLEVERINNDAARAIPEDFDKMASCEPEEAIWVVMARDAGHRVLEALLDPPEGEPRVEKAYQESTPPHQFRIETSGLTAVYPVTYLRKQIQ